MKLHHFVSGSSVLIAGWLMMTFFHDVSPQQYPQQRRGTPAHSASRAPLKAAEAPVGAVGMPRGGRGADTATLAAMRTP
jgi:hypothetical protein